MAGPFYVDSVAVGLNDGTSWTDAWTSIDSALTTVAAGEIIYVDDGHSENLAASKTWTITATAGNPYQILSVDKADDSLSSGAVIQATGGNYDLIFAGSVYIYGLDIQAGGFMRLDPGASGQTTVENCTLTVSVNMASEDLILGNTVEQSRVLFFDTNIYLDGTSSYILYTHFRWRNGTLTTDSTQNFIFAQAADGCDLRVTGVDVSAHNSPLTNSPSSGYATGVKSFENCVIHASTSSVLDAVPAGLITVARMHHCQSGTDADPSYALEERSYFGIMKVDTARYRTGGASDNERTNPISYEIVSNANCKEIYAFAESPPIAAWTDGNGTTSHTYTIYFASDATMQDDEVWMEIFLPNDATTSSQAARQSTRMNPQSTPANITTDGSSTWTGTGVGTKQKLSVSYTPDKPGPVVARVHLAKASDTIYVDPLIEIT